MTRKECGIPSTPVNKTQTHPINSPNYRIVKPIYIWFSKSNVNLTIVLMHMDYLSPKEPAVTLPFRLLKNKYGQQKRKRRNKIRIDRSNKIQIIALFRNARTER